MARWIAFDEESTALAAAQSGMAVSFQRGDALATALASSKPAVVLVPGDSSDEVIVVELRPNPAIRSALFPSRQEVSQTDSAESPVGLEASGFLGLSDAPVFEQEETGKKTWWKRLLD